MKIFENESHVAEGKFILKDIIYDITCTSLFAVSEDMELFIFPEIDAETADESVEYEMRNAYLYHNNGFNTHVSTFAELKGKRFIWDDEYNSDNEEAGTLCVQEHENIPKGTIEILDVKDTQMTIRWSGLANVDWSEEYGENVPFDTVFSVEIPDKMVYRVNAYKTVKVNIDNDTQLEILNLDEFNEEVTRISTTQQWNQFHAVLKFKLTYAGTGYLGEVIFPNSKNNYITNIEQACPRKVHFRSFNFNFRVNYEMFSFEIEPPYSYQLKIIE